jgi:hypothetical protein
MPTINSRVKHRIDLALGFLGVFLIGLIGWICDHVTDTTYRAETGTREHPVLRSGQGQRAGLSGK